jgi:membrane protein
LKLPDIHAPADRLAGFLKTDMWRLRLEDLPRWQAFFIRQLQALVLAVRRYIEDRCMQRASSLTFYSLLSIVPVFAMIFGIAKGFGFEKLLEKQLYKEFAGQEAVLNRIITFSDSLLAHAQGGVIAGIGLLVLLWSVLKVLNNIEASFNDIWQVHEARNWSRKFSDYTSVMLISPVLVVLSGSATVFIQTRVAAITERLSVLEMIGPVIFFLLKFTPYVLIWILFSLIYLIMPNTKVSYRAGIPAGIIAGTLYQLAQWVYIGFQIDAARYSAIYGSFAALPLFLMWIQISWWIVLFGAELSYAYQNVDAYDFAPAQLNISPGNRKLLTLYVFHRIVKHFLNGEPPLNSDEISSGLDMPTTVVKGVLADLVESGLVSQTIVADNKGVAYQPARDIHQLTISAVLGALEHRGSDKLPAAQSSELRELENALHDLQLAMQESEADRLLIDIGA